ncbi:MAG: amino acid adenylation domain-containing protein [Bryobacterales bacterium]|nr:amino acid adenylation domain-containing protein [Bryobacterales bacterium]MBV9396404.1 amino acid adenylation domain-containing protein [Bryobacterales bacterium]
MSTASNRIAPDRLSAASLPGSREQDRNLCLHQIIEAWAARTPQSVAVFYEGETLTYGELNRRANRLARVLQRRGIGVGSLVGVSMARSLEMIVGILAILKAGAAYVPLDPRLPQERLSFLISDGPIAVVLTRSQRLQAGGALVLDVKAEAGAGEEDGDLQAAVTNADLVYVIYTSGSTGQPKGVMVPHRGVVNWLVWMRNTFEATPRDVVLKKAPLTFDVSAWELFLPLISGARLVLADGDRQYDPAYLASLMASQRVTIAQFVPSLMRSFLDLEEMPDLSALRHVMCGGEILTPKLQDRFLERLSSEVCNSYGPTEASIGVTRWPCRRGDSRDTVPIGGPVDNTELYILDPDLNPVPPGVPGELYIGGICLGRGYLNRPDLTAERFLPNPFNSAYEARMYRTGDLCRFLHDGNIDFIGRRDDQVKVHGVRIELAEVEKAIAGHSSVEAAAAAAEDRGGDTILAAYVVPISGSQVTDRELRAFLRLKLPPSMIPTEFIFVEGLPLSPNGKVDRKKLASLRPAPEQRSFTEPRDALERRIADLWAEVLKERRFGIDDDFFDCGGDSLLATQVLIRLERDFKIRIPLDRLLGAFTIEEIARILRPRPSGSPGASTRHLTEGCRVASFDDIRGIFQVCSRAFPGYADCSFEDFEKLCAHRWLKNPFRKADDPFGWVLENESGEIVGFHGLVPVRLWIGGQSYPASAPTTWAVDPGYGRAGLGLLSEFLNWGQDRFLLNTTANAVTSALHSSSSIGMKPIPLQDFDQRLLWILDFKALVQWKTAQSAAPELWRRIVASWPAQSILAVSAPLAFGISGGASAALRGGFRRMEIRFKCRPLQITQVDRCGAEFDELWERLKGRYAVTTERTLSFLQWRHGNSPRLLGKSYMLACRDKGKLTGYAALREPINTAPGHFILTDLFYDRENPEVFPTLMNGAFEFVSARKASVLEVFGFHPSLNRQLKTQNPYVLRRSQLEHLGRTVSFAGMARVLDPRTRKTHSSTYWYHAPNSELEAICSAGSWWPSGVDGDLNL